MSTWVSRSGAKAYKYGYDHRHPWHRADGESWDEFVSRRNMHKLYGVWPLYGEGEDAFARRREAIRIKSAAEVRKAELTDVGRAVESAGEVARGLGLGEVAVGDDRELDIDVDGSSPEELAALSGSIAKAALTVALGKLGLLDAARLVGVAHKAVQIKQLVSGDPTSIVLTQESEKAERIAEIARELEKLGVEGEELDEEGGLSRRFEGIGVESR